MLLDALLPIRCPLCSRPGPAPCPACASTVSQAVWAGKPGGLTSLHAAFAYEGRTRTVMAALKYRGATAVVQWLADAMVTSMTDRLPDRLPGGGGHPPSWVTWAPTTAARRRERGFDQAELLATAVASRLDLPVVRSLRRRGSSHQTGQSRSARLGARDLFDPVVGTPPAPVLLIDDVCTTGATLSAAAAVLLGAGAGVVHALVAARTP